MVVAFLCRFAFQQEPMGLELLTCWPMVWISTIGFLQTMAKPIVNG